MANEVGQSQGRMVLFVCEVQHKEKRMKREPAQGK